MCNAARKTGGEGEIGPPGRAPDRAARTLFGVSLHGWMRATRRVAQDTISDRVGLAAAGCAFWATLALFPAISILISLYGLMFDPTTVEPQLGVLRDFLPPAGFELIAQRIHALVLHERSSLGVSLGIGMVLALWSASTGTKSMISALNEAYKVKETRGVLRFQSTGLLLTLGGMVAAILTIALLVALPVAIDFVGLDPHSRRLLQVGSFAVLVVFLGLALSALYRFGPARIEARWHWATPGSALATLLWLAASALLSFYVGHLARFDATYGPLGAVVGIMMWFWVSAYVVLIGAELNAELEMQRSEAAEADPPEE